MNPLDNAALKRMLAFIITAGAVLLSKKFGIELSETEKAELVALASFYIGQSAWKETALKKAEAAGEAASISMTDIEKAVENVLARTKGPQP